MATKNSTRIGIWVIAAVMLVGTLGSFAAMMIQPTNDKIDQQNAEEQLAQQQEMQRIAAEERAKTTEPIEGYTAEKFDGASVDELQKEVLVEGDGAVLKATDSISVSYFGWLADGRIFDSSTISGKNTPIDIPLNGVIEGWTEGIVGEKVGSTIKLIIPADKAYGSQASGIIPANAPLAFILRIHNLSETNE